MAEQLEQFSSQGKEQAENSKAELTYAEEVKDFVKRDQHYAEIDGKSITNIIREANAGSSEKETLKDMDGKSFEEIANDQAEKGHSYYVLAALEQSDLPPARRIEILRKSYMKECDRIREKLSEYLPEELRASHEATLQSLNEIISNLK